MVREGDPIMMINLTRSQSRENTFNQILEALQDDNISHVALCGLRGSGKTTFAKQVGKRAMELGIFKQAVFVPVTTTPNVKKIQGAIADQLGLRLGEEADLAARQKQISRRLRKEEPVLMILDDIRDRLDLQEIGISNEAKGFNLRLWSTPSQGRTGCKFLLTADIQEVGYTMGCQLRFHLRLLTEEEAWNLLRKHAGIDDGSPNLIDAAKEVAKQCQGLPLASVVIGSALRGKTVDQWKEVLETLQGLPVQCLRSEDDSSKFGHHIIEAGYSGLSSREAKTIFLICGLLPEDHEILIEDLSQYAIRIGLCSKNEAIAAINRLNESGLLMHSDKSKDHVIMNTLARDIARMIVYEANPPNKVARIRDYLFALYNEEDFQWHEALDRLLHQLYCVSEYPSSSTATATSHGGEGCEPQVVRSYSDATAATSPEPSGKQVDFKGLCRVDKSFLPLLQEACEKRPHLMESQRIQPVIVRTRAFDCLGLLLFMVHNVTCRDLDLGALEIFWKQLKVYTFDLEWLSPMVEEVFSSTKTARIEALQEKEKHLNEEAAMLRERLKAVEDEAAKLRDEAVKLRERLKVVEDKAAEVRTEIALTESKVNDFAIADVTNA